MTVYPDADAASMNYVLLRERPEEINDQSLLDVIENFRFGLIDTALRAARKVLDDDTLSLAYVRGYVKQTLLQIEIDVSLLKEYNQRRRNSGR